MSSQPLHPAFLASQPVNRGAISLTKRLFDLLGASALILLFAPVFFAVYLLARRDGGPALFAHERVGQNGRLFHCLKFRTMVPDAAARLDALLASDPAARAEWAATHKLANDPRVTAIGRFLRRTSLDELPQLFNILRGEMSLVGPRPVTAAEMPRYGQFAEPVLRHRPGLTGLWQVSGRNNISYDARVQQEVEYCQRASFWLDLSILLRTVGIVFAGSGK